MSVAEVRRPSPRHPQDPAMPEQVERIRRQALESNPFVKAIRVMGGFYAFVFETFRQIFRRPFQFEEFVDQAWFISSVAIGPAIMVAIPFCVIIIFEVNQLLIQIGAVDLAGSAAAVAVIREIGPIVSVLVVAGAGATAVCADLGARKIRDEIDAMETLGINPIQRLVVPRILASTLVAVALNGLVSIVGLFGGYYFSVVLQGATPGLFISDLTLLVGLPDFIAAEVKSAVFGVIAALVACYLGLNAKGGPKGVGEAVNQTVVYSFMALFAANSIITTVFLRINGTT
jgi:phospholipid/cholesterol/gamma-HCH transport system permease protein